MVGGGLNVAAFGGRRDLMEQLAPLGEVYQAGTLSGNPLALAAGLAVLQLIRQEGFYERLATIGTQPVAALTAAATATGVPFSAQAVGGMVGIYFAEQVPGTFAEVQDNDIERFWRFFQAMLDNGVYLAPSAYEAGFISTAHDETVIADTQAAEKAFDKVRRFT